LSGRVSVSEIVNVGMRERDYAPPMPGYVHKW
jgi:hypothetical protein